MYAVVKTGGKQYKVAAGDILKVEKLAGAQGDTVELGEVLLVADDAGVRTGAPLIDGIVVSAEILEQAKGDKVVIFKKKRRHNYRRKRGHRQNLTVLKVLDIGAPGAVKKAAPKKAAPKKAEVAAKTAGEAPEKTTTTQAAVKKPAVT
ncbi:MAG: 50S ribosomal protein L21, partial [Pseudomonadota bacterium]